MESTFDQFLLPNDEEMWSNICKTNGNFSPLRKLLPHSKNVMQSNNSSRKWKILHSNSKILMEFNEETPALASVDVRTRNDTQTGQVPERLYSSLKYEVTQDISAHIFGQNTAVLMSKIQVVNPYNFDEEILKPNGKPIVKGTSEFIPLTLNTSTNGLYCKTKIQFTDVSYHHEKKYFSMKVSYFDANNLNEPLFVQMSAPFQVFARRPRRKSLKRKTTNPSPTVKKVKEEEKEEEEEPIVVQPLTNLDFFLRELDVLSGLKEKLNGTEEKIAMEFIQKKLFPTQPMTQSIDTDQLQDLDFFSL